MTAPILDLNDEVVRAVKGYYLTPTIAGKQLMERALRRQKAASQEPRSHCLGCKADRRECGMHKVCRRP